MAELPAPPLNESGIGQAIDYFLWPDLPNKQKKLEELPPAPTDALPVVLPVVLRNICREAGEAFKIPIEAAIINALACWRVCKQVLQSENQERCGRDYEN